MATPQRLIVLALTLLLALAACGAPGVSVDEPEAPAPAVAEAPDIAATVAAQVEATMAAQQVPPPPEAEQGETEAVEETPVADVPTATSEPTTAPTTAPTEQPTASDTAPSVPATSAVDGEAMLVATSANTALVNTLNSNGWTISDPDYIGNFCRTGKGLVDTTGAFWMNCDSFIRFSSDGTSWTRPTGGVGKMLSGTQGDVWTVTTMQIVRYVDGEETEYTPEETIETTRFPADTAALGPDGTLWLYGTTTDPTPRFLYSFDGTEWKNHGPHTEILPERANNSGLLFVTSANEVLFIRDGILRFTNGRFEYVITEERFIELLGKPLVEIRNALELPDGQIWIATELGILVLQDEQIRLIGPEQGLPSRNIYDLALDTAGRVWVATGYGIAVQNGDGWDVALPSTSEMNDSHFVGLAVRGAPELPAPLAEPRTSTIFGRLSENGRPIPNVAVQLCSDTISGGSGGVVRGSTFDPDTQTPCGRHYYSQLTQTDDQGNYRFENVPVGVYDLAVQLEGQWSFAPSSLSIQALEPGEEVGFDIPL